VARIRNGSSNMTDTGEVQYRPNGASATVKTGSGPRPKCIQTMGRPDAGLSLSPGFCNASLGANMAPQHRRPMVCITLGRGPEPFYEVADARSAYIGPRPYRSCLTTVPDVGHRAVLGSAFSVPRAGSRRPIEQNTGLFGFTSPSTFSPGYDIHTKLPYAEHFNLSMQREWANQRCSRWLTSAPRAPPHHTAGRKPRLSPLYASNWQGAIDVTAGPPAADQGMRTPFPASDGYHSVSDGLVRTLSRMLTAPGRRS